MVSKKCMEVVFHGASINDLSIFTLIMSPYQQLLFSGFH